MKRCPSPSDDDIVRVRQRVRDWAVALGFSLVDQTKLVTAASELARNTLVYGQGGTLLIETVLNDQQARPAADVRGSGARHCRRRAGAEGRLHHRQRAGARPERRPPSLAGFRAHLASRARARASSSPDGSSRGAHRRSPEPTDVAEARRRAADRRRALGLRRGRRIGRVAIVVTEAATNLLKHAGGGELFVGPTAARDVRGVQVLAIDRGRRHSERRPRACATATRPSAAAGTGLGAISASSASSFDLYTQPGRGTVIAATIYPAARRSRSAIGGVSVPMRGEDECGDGWAVWSAGELTSVFVVRRPRATAARRPRPPSWRWPRSGGTRSGSAATSSRSCTTALQQHARRRGCGRRTGSTSAALAPLLRHRQHQRRHRPARRRGAASGQPRRASPVTSLGACSRSPTPGRAAACS